VGVAVKHGKGQSNFGLNHALCRLIRGPKGRGGGDSETLVLANYPLRYTCCVGLPLHSIVSDTNTVRSTPSDYSDDYATCAETYATLRVYTGKIPPKQVMADLRLRPTKLLSESKDGLHLNGWLLSSKGTVDSLDVRRHVDWLLERIFDRRTELLALQSQPGVWMDFSATGVRGMGTEAPHSARSK